MIYDSVEEANNRLGATVVTYEGRPVYVQEVIPHDDGVMRVKFREFPFSGDLIRKKINSPAFKRFETIPLGFMNLFAAGRRHAVFCERTPNRQRRQGLSGDTFSSSSLIGERGVGFSDAITTDAFREMVLGEYPPYDEVLSRLVPNSSIAVDREFAVLRTPEGYTNVYHKRDNIGVVIRGNLYLRPDRRFMVESIQENPNLPNRVEVM